MCVCVCACVCVCVCVRAIVACLRVLYIFAVLYWVCGSCFSIVHYLVGGSIGIVLGPIFGSIGCIACIVGAILLRVCLRVAAIQSRTDDIEATQGPAIQGTETRTQQTLVTGRRVIFERVANTEATQVPSPGTGRIVILLRRVCRVPVTNPDAPPPYVPSADVQSFDPPPYTTNSANCPLHISVEDMPTPQPHPPESPPSNPIEDPPEYLPPPGRDQDREPLLAEEQ